MKLRLLQIANYFIPNRSYIENNYCKLLSKDNTYKNYIISINKTYVNEKNHNVLKNKFKNRDIKKGVYKENGCISYRLKALFEYRYKIWLIGLIKILRKIKPDIVYAHGITNISTIRIAIFKLLTKSNFLFLIHEGIIENINSKNIITKLYKYIFSHIVNKTVDYYLPISEETKNILINDFNCKGKFKTLYLGGDDTIFYPNPQKRKEIRNKYNINNNDKVFIYSGKITSDKKIHFLIENFIELNKSFQNIFFFIIGTGTYKYIQELIKLSKQNKNIIFIDYLNTNELADYFNASDIGLWPFLETISVVEAQLCGLPVIINNSIISKERIFYKNIWSGYILYKDSDLYDLMKKFLENNNISRKNAIMNSTRFKNTIIIDEFKKLINETNN